MEISPLCTQFAVSSGNTEIIHILENKNLKFGTDCFECSILFHQNQIFEWLILNHADNTFSLQPYLEYSIIYFNEEILYLLIHYGCDITSLNQIDILNEPTYPIHLALYSFNFPLFKYIYENYYQTLNPINEMFDINSLFKLALKLNEINAFQYFLTKGNERTLVQYAFVYHNLKFVKFLVEHGCDINLEDKSGNLPFFTYFDESIAKYIGSIKKDELPVDRKGRTFLHFSAFHNSLELVKYFLFQLIE